MKTKRMFFTALVFAIICGFTVSATEIDAITLAKNDLRKKIHQELRNFSVFDVTGLNKCNTLDIHFRVTETNRIEIVNMESANQDLLRYVKQRLSNNSLMASELLQGQSYKISFRFVDARKPGDIQQ